MGFFSKLLGGKREQAVQDAPAALREFLKRKLPQNYLTSPLYEAEITQAGESYIVRVTLDMTADGSDFSDFKLQDYLDLSELESGYVMDCLSDPPVEAQFQLELAFDEKGQRLLREFYAAQQG